MRDTKKATKGSAVFTDEEKAAMKEHAADQKKAARRGKSNPEADERDVLDKIAELADADRAMAERIHALVKANAPTLAPRTWYGMPAYAFEDKVVCFFQPALKFKARYATLGFNDAARLDDGTMWPTSWALTKLTAADEATIVALLKKAVG